MKTVDFFSNETVKNGNALKKNPVKKDVKKIVATAKGRNLRLVKANYSIVRFPLRLAYHFLNIQLQDK